jgi:hypothetical protein
MHYSGILCFYSSPNSLLVIRNSMLYATFIHQAVHNWLGRDLIFLGNDQTTNPRPEIPAKS